MAVVGQADAIGPHDCGVKTQDRRRTQLERRGIGHEVGHDREQLYQHVGWRLAYQLNRYLPISGYDPYGVISEARDHRGRNVNTRFHRFPCTGLGYRMDRNGINRLMLRLDNTILLWVHDTFFS